MPKKPSLTLIKLGGSVITDKNTPYTANISAIRSIATLLKHIKSPLIISHGSGSFGHTSAATFGGKNGYTSRIGIATVARDAMAINSIVIEQCIDLGLPVISFRPMSFLLAESGQVKHQFYTPIEQALSQSLIPVVYGDVIWDTQWKSTIFSGETTLGYLATHFQKTYTVQVIELCDVAGVLDKQGNVISDITPHKWDAIKTSVIKKTQNDVTGGMAHKVEEALHLATHAISTHIISGKEIQVLEDIVVHGKLHGTHIHL